MNELFFDPQKSLGFLTITTHRLINVLLRRRMVQAGLDLTGEQWGVLFQIWNRGGVSQDELVRVACVDKSTMSRTLSLMEKKGLIRRLPDPDDARRKVICATDKAFAMKERSREVTLEVLDFALRDVEEKDRDVCLKTLATVSKTLGGALK